MNLPPLKLQVKRETDVGANLFAQNVSVNTVGDLFERIRTC